MEKISFGLTNLKNNEKKRKLKENILNLFIYLVI